MISSIKTYSTSQRISLIASIFLILIKISEKYWPKLLFGSNLEETPFEWLYVMVSFVILVAIILLERENLEDLLIDKLFLLLLISAGTLYGFYYADTIVQEAILVATFILLEFWRRRKLKFGSRNASIDWGTVLIATLPVVVIIVFLSTRLLIERVPYDDLFLWKTATTLWMICYTEIVFRGLLYNLLKKLGAKNLQIFIIQLILFWIYQAKFITSHWYLMLIPLLLGAWLGLLAWRSKSLAPGTLAYFLSTFIFMLAGIA